jgi:hypothetical protein
LREVETFVVGDVAGEVDALLIGQSADGGAQVAGVFGIGDEAVEGGEVGG